MIGGKRTNFYRVSMAGRDLKKLLREHLEDTVDHFLSAVRFAWDSGSLLLGFGVILVIFGAVALMAVLFTLLKVR